ncbi:Vesicle-associated membrane-protein-associated protein [Sesbania bispinosa]|nr:Vesicle-associated membrane-protein-associated protein [Sesbania bispinosa]
MNKAPILDIEPSELEFIFELKKQSSCSVQLSNNTHHYVAFKVKTTSPKKYSVRPNVGVLAPKATCEFIVTMQAQRVAPEDMVCKDKFLVQSTLVSAETTSEDVTSSLFVKDGSRYIEEYKLKVVLISPPDSPEFSPINGDSKNGLNHEKVQIYSKDEIQSPEHMVLNNPEPNMVHKVLKLEEDMVLKPEHHMGLDTMKDVEEPEEEAGLKLSKDDEFSIVKDVEELKPLKKLELQVSKDPDLETVKNAEELKPAKEVELKVSKDLDLNTRNNSGELKPEKEAELNSGATISTLTEERRLSIQETKILQEKLADLVNKGPRKVQVGFPLLYVCMVALISVVLGYHLHS